MRKSVRERLMEAKRLPGSSEHMTLDDLILLLLDPRPRSQRAANPTQMAFIKDPAPFKAFVGPKGSAKTSAGCAAGWIRALMQPGSKGLVARNDYNDLKATTRLRMEEMLHRLPKGTLLDRSKDPPETWYVKAMPVLSAEGDVIDDTPSQICFLGLESAGDMGSYEFDWAFLDEASEIKDERTFTAVSGLLRNRPRWWEMFGIGDYTVMMALNPTDVFHWIYTACTGLNHQGKKVRDPYVKLFFPQPRENQRNLPRNYYTLMDNMPIDQRSRLRDGKWGATFEGDPVVPEFKLETHVRPQLMEKYDPFTELMRFWDFGFRRPYVVWAQQDYDGYLYHFKELLGENEEIEQFVERVFALERKFFPEQRVRDRLDYGDPAARQRKDTGSTQTYLTKVGIHLRYQITTVEEGLRAVRTYMNRMIKGLPMLQYDQEGVPVLARAWGGGYHFKKGDNGTKLVPVKDGFYDHPADADRYGIVCHLGRVPDLNALATSMPASLEYRPDSDIYARG